MSDAITRLNAALEGRYEIERELGEGGMATVYLADDLRHERKVALKVLKPELAAVVGAERFLAEIKTTANLQHPHILPLFDSGEADSFLFYVMPFVEGESLRNRLEREKQLPVDEAVRIATDVAEALHSAHQQGVIHRDIKPANILLSQGRPLVADFGIALAVSQAGGGRLTETGLSMGTPYYMSPEQASADREPTPASDVYSLGCVLYEMLVGEPPYAGSSAQAVLAKILMGDAPAATETRSSIPSNVDAAIRMALEKLPADRFASVQDFASALANAGFRHGESVEVPGATQQLWNPLSVAMTMLAAASTLIAGLLVLRPDAPVPVLRSAVAVPDSVALVQDQGVNVALSPDGLLIVFVGAASGGGQQLWRRPLNELDPTPIPDTEGAGSPRFSPDGGSLVFVVNNRITTLALGGAPPQTLDLDLFETIQVPTWGPDGMIYFTGEGGGIWRIPVIGGEPERVTTVASEYEIRAHVAPDVLPDGRGVLFTRVVNVASGTNLNDIAVAPLAGGEPRVLFPGTMARYAATGHVVYTTVDGTVLAAPLDTDRLEIGPARTLLEGTATRGAYSHFALSEVGSLAYLPGVTTGSASELVWMTREGEAEPVELGWQFDPPSANFGWSLSPNEDRVALTTMVDGNTDVWIKQLPDGPFERLTFTDAEDTYAVWSPDGEHVTYASQDAGADFDIWRARADGTGAPELLMNDSRGLLDPDWHPDGTWMLARTGAFPPGIGGRDVVAFMPGVDSVTNSLVATSDFAEQAPALSPNGRWLAYVSNRTGEHEVYVSPFPNVDSSRQRVSTEGGVRPRWSRSGTELFFMDVDRRLVAARVETDANFQVNERVPLFTFGPDYLAPWSGASDFYDVSRDDRRFLLGRRVGGGTEAQRGQAFVLVQGFFEELEQRVGGN